MGILVPVLGYLLSRTRPSANNLDPTLVGSVTDFPVGTGKVVAVNDKPVILVNTKAGDIKAFSAICTHLGYIVDYKKEKGVIHSPCHDGLFNPVTGAVVGGPPPRPLPAYELWIKDAKVYVGRPLGKIYGT
ncbi:MAG: Rieske (2Fe-2S) protein [Chloroflexi bacterium]|nr:Rieske (2Fe-2S) protein [Chloroflexota bacterium]